MHNEEPAQVHLLTPNEVAQLESAMSTELLEALLAAYDLGVLHHTLGGDDRVLHLEGEMSTELRDALQQAYDQGRKAGAE